MYAARSCIVSASSLSSNLEPNSPMATGRTACRVKDGLSQDAGLHEMMTKMLSFAEQLKYGWQTHCRQRTAYELLRTSLCTAQGRRPAVQWSPCEACLVLNKSSCTCTEQPASYPIDLSSSRWPAYVLRRNGCCKQAVSSAWRPSALAHGP